MPLKLYRRHRKECEARHPIDSRTSEFDESKRGWKRCACLIHASGTIAGKLNRKQTGVSDWERAKAITSAWEQAGNWDGKPVAPPPPASTPIDPAHPQRITIASAIEAYLASRSNRDIEFSTMVKYKTITNQLKAFADLRGYLMLDQLTVTDMDIFYASWKDKKMSKGKKLERLKGFIKFCLKRKWMSVNLTEDLEAPPGYSEAADKPPYEEEEIDRMMEACRTLGAPVPPGPGHRPWSGQDAEDFITLSIHTGLSISDVALFNITTKLKGNHVDLRRHKTGHAVSVWIPDELVVRLRAREKQYGPLIFRQGEKMTLRSSTERWRTILAKVFKLAGQFKERPVPSRFRQTFVRIMLQSGMRPFDVATLIGDTEAIVLKHYAKWVVERQERLTDEVKAAHANRARMRGPKLMAISGGRAVTEKI
jgi:site-specific recombinase XerD